MKEMSIEFIKRLKTYDNKKYFEDFYSFLLAPVICGVKPASILTIKNFNKPMYYLWLDLGEEFLSKLNLNSILLRNIDGGNILLIFSKDALNDYLLNKENNEFLATYGYSTNSCAALDELCKRYKNSVPHECGIFLGIPKDDVEGYILKKNPVLVGYWQVYCNIDRAIKIFKIYDKSKEMVIKNVLSGKGFNEYYKELVNTFKGDYETILGFENKNH